MTRKKSGHSIRPKPPSPGRRAASADRVLSRQTGRRQVAADPRRRPPGFPRRRLRRRKHERHRQSGGRLQGHALCLFSVEERPVRGADPLRSRPAGRAIVPVRRRRRRSRPRPRPHRPWPDAQHVPGRPSRPYAHGHRRRREISKDRKGVLRGRAKGRRRTPRGLPGDPGGARTDRAAGGPCPGRGPVHPALPVRLFQSRAVLRRRTRRRGRDRGRGGRRRRRLPAPLPIRSRPDVRRCAAAAAAPVR